MFDRSHTLGITFLAAIPIIFGLDAADGIIARKRNETSEIGAVLDIVADRVIENTLPMEDTITMKFSNRLVVVCLTMLSLVGYVCRTNIGYVCRTNNVCLALED